MFFIASAFLLLTLPIQKQKQTNNLMHESLTLIWSNCEVCDASCHPNFQTLHWFSSFYTTNLFSVPLCHGLNECMMGTGVHTSFAREIMVEPESSAVLWARASAAVRLMLLMSHKKLFPARCFPTNSTFHIPLVSSCHCDLWMPFSCWYVTKAWICGLNIWLQRGWFVAST